MRVLLVDDEVYILRTLARRLERLGHEVIVAMTVHDAITWLGAWETHVDAVITDFQLPDGTGDAIARAALSRVDGRAVAIHSGSHISELMAVRALVADGVTLIPKPPPTGALEAFLAAASAH